MQTSTVYKDFCNFVRSLYPQTEIIPLHEPFLIGNEKKFVSDAIESSFVSSVGQYVDKFENQISKFTKCKYAIATVNGTSALHVSLQIVGAKKNTEVVTQSLTFAATCNAISYCGASPTFIDINLTSLGMCPVKLEEFFVSKCKRNKSGKLYNKETKREVVACLPVHTYGHPSDILNIKKICKRFNIPIIEDAAESIGSFYDKIHTGNFGVMGCLSFNGNKTITTGGGGMIITNNKKFAKKAKHITTTARKVNKWFIEHDQIGYNYRMPNINAAIGLGQIQKIRKLIAQKRKLARKYILWGKKYDISFFQERDLARSNYWLNTIIAKDKDDRDKLLEVTNKNNILTRPAWTPMHLMRIYKNSYECDLSNTEWIFDRLVNVPSSVTGLK
tara:strand:+ start:2463 stop:3626 length:1164 start_codon:yes stop_codon:yes gene_type:complete